MPLFLFTGSAVVTTLASPIAAADLSITVGSGTGWPQPTGGEVSVATIGDPANGDTEEKVLFSQRVGETLTVSQRGYDDTAAQDWPQGTKIRHTIAAVWANESSLHIHDTGRNDHTQYLLTSAHATLQHTDAMLATDSVGSDELKNNAVETANILNLAVTTAKIADAAVTNDKIANGAVTLGKIADGAISTAAKFGTGIRPVRTNATEPSLNLEAGDVWVDTDAGNRLYTYNGSIFVPVPMQLIEAKALSSDEQNINFTGIPGDFNNLRLFLFFKTNATGDTVRSIRMRFNGDSSASYHTQETEDGTRTQSLGVASMKIGEIDGASAFGGMAVVDIAGYAVTGVTARYTLGRCLSTQPANIVELNTIGQWNNTTDVIDTVNIFTSDVSTRFAAGTRAYLYGL